MAPYAEEYARITILAHSERVEYGRIVIPGITEYLEYARIVLPSGVGIAEYGKIIYAASTVSIDEYARLIIPGFFEAGASDTGIILTLETTSVEDTNVFLSVVGASYDDTDIYFNGSNIAYSDVDIVITVTDLEYKDILLDFPPIYNYKDIELEFIQPYFYNVYKLTNIGSFIPTHIEAIALDDTVMSEPLYSETLVLSGAMNMFWEDISLIAACKNKSRESIVPLTTISATSEDPEHRVNNLLLNHDECRYINRDSDTYWLSNDTWAHELECVFDQAKYINTIEFRFHEVYAANDFTIYVMPYNTDSWKPINIIYAKVNDIFVSETDSLMVNPVVSNKYAHGEWISFGIHKQLVTGVKIVFDAGDDTNNVGLYAVGIYNDVNIVYGGQFEAKFIPVFDDDIKSAGGILDISFDTLIGERNFVYGYEHEIKFVSCMPEADVVASDIDITWLSAHAIDINIYYCHDKPYCDTVLYAYLENEAFKDINIILGIPNDAFEDIGIYLDTRDVDEFIDVYYDAGHEYIDIDIYLDNALNDNEGFIDISIIQGVAAVAYFDVDMIYISGDETSDECEGTFEFKIETFTHVEACGDLAIDTSRIVEGYFELEELKAQTTLRIICVDYLYIYKDINMYCHLY